MVEITDGMEVDTIDDHGGSNEHNLAGKRRRKNASDDTLERSYKEANLGGGRRKEATTSTLKLKSESPVSEPTLKAIKEMSSPSSFKNLDATIQQLMGQTEVFGFDLTFSREPLTFLTQTVELLYHSHFGPCDGAGVIAVFPTRRLAFEMYAMGKEILKYHSLTLALAVGGLPMKAAAEEAERLRTGANLIAATPWRLLNLLQSPNKFRYENLKFLMIDQDGSGMTETDEQTINQIKQILPKTVVVKRKSSLFGAISRVKVSMQHGYCVVPSAKRFLRLYSFLKRKHLKKVIVFFSSCNSVKFHCELLKCFHMECFDIHEEKELQSSQSTISDFGRAWTGTLLCTEFAARDFRLPAVDWIVQYEPPDGPKIYVDEIGVISRDTFFKANTLLFLIPEELQFLQLFQDVKVPIRKMVFPGTELDITQKSMEKEVANNIYLHKSAEDAYRSYISVYTSHSMKDIFNFDSLNLQAVAASFGLPTTPRMIRRQQQAQVQQEICSKMEGISMDSGPETSDVSMGQTS